MTSEEYSSIAPFSYDVIDWQSLGEGQTFDLLQRSFRASNGSALETLRMFDAAARSFRDTDPEIAARLEKALEERHEMLLALHLEGAGMSVSDYLNHDGNFGEAALHLSDYARWRFRSVIEEFPETVNHVISLGIRHLNASPERVRAQIAALV